MNTIQNQNACIQIFSASYNQIQSTSSIGQWVCSHLHINIRNSWHDHQFSVTKSFLVTFNYNKTKNHSFEWVLNSFLDTARKCTASGPSAILRTRALAWNLASTKSPLSPAPPWLCNDVRQNVVNRQIATMYLYYRYTLSNIHVPTQNSQSLQKHRGCLNYSVHLSWPVIVTIIYSGHTKTKTISSFVFLPAGV